MSNSFSSLHRPPLHRLRNETLSYIFLAAFRAADDRWGAMMTSITLSHVSTRWRNAAISTGILWTNIFITFPTSCTQFSRAVTWLRRSRSYPINILLDLRDPAWEWDLAEPAHKLRWTDMEYLLRLLMIHVKRWRHLELLTDTWMPIFAFLSYTRRVQSAPSLESISLSRCNAYFASKDAKFSPDEMKKPIPFFGGLLFDKLREVTLTGVHVDWARSSLLNLTVLEFKYLANDVAPSLNEFVDILHACPDLQHLSIMGRGPNLKVTSAAEVSPKPTGDDKDLLPKTQLKIHLQHLTRFTFGFVDIDYALKLLPFFSFPAIEELTLEALPFSMEWDPLEAHIHSLDATPILEQFMTSGHPEPSRESSSTLIHIPLDRVLFLHLEGINTSESTFLRFFNTLQSLQRLCLVNTHENALCALASISEDRQLTPCLGLKELTCRDMDATAFETTVTARAGFESASKLIKKSFKTNIKMDAKINTRLIDAGIEIIHDAELYPLQEDLSSNLEVGN